MMRPGLKSAAPNARADCGTANIATAIEAAKANRATNAVARPE